MRDCLDWSWLGGGAGLGPGREPWKSQVFWLIKESKIGPFGSHKIISTLSPYFFQNEVVSETWALPITILFAMVAYAVVASVFYNIDG